MVDRYSHVVTELSRYSGRSVRHPTYTMICCPFHSDATPSGRVSHKVDQTSPGSFYCYGCGARASWNELAPKIGLQPWAYAPPSERYLPEMPTLEAAASDEQLDLADLPPDKTWRSIPTNLLIDIGCRLLTEPWGARRIYMPIQIGDTVQGWIKARIRKEQDKPSYINKPGRWSAEYGLFPFQYVKPVNNTIVLVEGPRDALRLLVHGIPALAILGTQSWSQTKTRVLALTGATRIVLCMDGDPAGIKAVETLRPKLRDFFEVKVFKLWGDDSPYAQVAHKTSPSKAARRLGISLWDPMSMPIKKVRELSRTVNT